MINKINAQGMTLVNSLTSGVLTNCCPDCSLCGTSPTSVQKFDESTFSYAV